MPRVEGGAIAWTCPRDRWKRPRRKSIRDLISEPHTKPRLFAGNPLAKLEVSEALRAADGGHVFRDRRRPAFGGFLVLMPPSTRIGWLIGKPALSALIVGSRPSESASRSR